MRVHSTGRFSFSCAKSQAHAHLDAGVLSRTVSAVCLCMQEVEPHPPSTSMYTVARSDLAAQENTVILKDGGPC